MKILLITSFYSALRESIIEDNWRPFGMPAISKLLEGLKVKDIYFDNVFIEREAKKKEYKVISNSMFNNFIHLIKIRSLLNIKYLNNLLIIVDNIKLIIKTRRILLKNNYDIVYVDRENIVIGAWFAIAGYKVVLRLHGVSNLYENFRNLTFRISNPIKYLSYKAPFKYIICTEDGTPAKEFLRSFINKGVPFRILLNGVDDLTTCCSILNNRIALQVPNDIPVILFVGRMSIDKGILEFVNAIREVQKRNDKFFTVIVGDGKYFNDVKAKISDFRIKNILLTGSIEHSNIYDYFHNSDIYVSLNKLGNLSNTVLEAINAGLSIITLKKTELQKKDFETYELLGDVSFYVSRDNIVQELSSLLIKLLDDHDLIERQKKKMTEIKTKLFPWSHRIEIEIKIIERLLYNIN